MQSLVDEDDELQEHAKNRDNVFRSLQKTCAASCRSVNLSETVRQKSDVVNDLLTELQPRDSQTCEENRVTCYRCRNLLSVPENLLKRTYDKISDSTGECESDVAFVQAIVWLKSAIESMREVPVEQFHLIFHQQWNANPCDRDTARTATTENFDTESNRNVIEEENRDTNIDVNVNTTSNANLLSNAARSLKRGVKLSDRRRRKDEAEYEGTRNVTFSPVISLTPQRYCGDPSQKDHWLSDRIIPDSDEDYASCSDIFKDSSQYQETEVDFKDVLSECRVEERNRIIEDSLEEDSTFSRAGSFQLNSKTGNGDGQRSQCILRSEEYGSLTSDISTFFSEASQFREGVNPLENEKGGEWLSEHICPKITPLSDEHSQALRERLLMIPEIKEIICEKGDSAYDTWNFEFGQNSVSMDVDWIGELLGSGEKEMGTRQPRNEDENLPKVSQNLRTSPVHSDDRINEKINVQKTRRLSSEWVNFTLDALNADEVTLRSVKVILSFFEDERIARTYAKRRCWTSTLEADAVNAVLNFCNIYESNQRTDACTREIVRTTTRTLDNIMRDTELNKVTLWTHRVPIILEFCNSLQVCVSTTDHLIGELQSYERIVASIGSEETNVWTTVSQLHILLYALTICLTKYRLITERTRVRPSDRPITAVLDLWKQRLNDAEYPSVDESVGTTERRWLTALESFAIASSENFVQFAAKSRGLFRALSR